MDVEVERFPGARPIYQRGQIDSIFLQKRTSTMASWTRHVKWVCQWFLSM